MTKRNTVLVVDTGGRGAALVDKYLESKFVEKALAVPGNDLMKVRVKKVVKTYPQIKTTNIKSILEICKKEKVTLVDVASDNAVAVGLVDALIRKNISVVGPTKKAGQIEWDKAWARKFMDKYNIPSPKFKIFNSQKKATDFIKKQKDTKWFIKASGLAGGKGAIPARDRKAAIVAINSMKNFGKSGKKFLIEQWLDGEEFSAFAFCDGITFKIAGYAQDHKRVSDKDQGPNTGGMGCVSNPLIVNKNIKNQASAIFKKTLEGLGKEKRQYKGTLYLGGMVLKNKVYVIEFNARWGDPEAQVVVSGLNVDFFEMGMEAAKGTLRRIKISDDGKVRVAVAGVAKGYPRVQEYSQVKGKQIFGLEDAGRVDGVVIYGAGVKIIDGKHYVGGGRLFYAVGEGKDVIEASQKAYEAMDKVRIEGNNLHFRTDIGWRDVQRLRK